MWWVAFGAFGGAFLCSLVMTYLVRGWSIRTGFIDRPGGHKQHREPVALGGGLAIVMGACLPIACGYAIVAAGRMGLSFIPLPSILQPHVSGMFDRAPTLLAILAAAVGLHIVGWVDDRRPLGPGVKFVLQILAALYVAWPVGIRAMETLPPALSIALTVAWIVLITNAFNFMDNMDGLSAGVAAIAAAIFGVAAAHAGQIFVPTLAWILSGAAAGFLWFNFAPARIFMGDAGSLPMGFLLSILTILTNYYEPGRRIAPLGVLVPLLVLAVPLYDVASVVVRRVRLGLSPFRGDRRHFSHRLVNRGMTDRGAVLMIYLATAATGLPAILVPRLPWYGGALLLLQCLCVVAMVAILEHVPQDRVPSGVAGPGSPKPDSD